jgi:hypothetical protein
MVAYDSVLAGRFTSKVAERLLAMLLLAVPGEGDQLEQVKSQAADLKVDLKTGITSV